MGDLCIGHGAFFRQVIKNNSVVLLDFFATWCGPCKVISPVVSKKSEDEKYKHVVYFGKIKVEVLSNLSDELDVQAMPTFLLFKDGVQVANLLEPKPAELVELLDQTALGGSEGDGERGARAA